MADQETQEQLQADLGTLQEDWDELQNLLGRRMELTQAIIKVGGTSAAVQAPTQFSWSGSGARPGPRPWDWEPDQAQSGTPLKFLY